jgi:16S rRNA C967 or C1407 C5-methylase (RsmB/RsmF family)
LDGLIARQKDLLENASKFVALDGRLVYCVFTLDKKEGHNQIASFLHSHEGWKLEKEEQLFAYDGLEATCYYAVLLNEANVAKMTPSISEINAAGLSSSTSLAKGK